MTIASPPIVGAGGDLAHYLREIRRFPLLEPEQEFMLAQRWRANADADAAHALVTSHLRLVAKIAMGYRGYGLPLDELVAEGNIGMMRAVKGFDPDRGFRLATYSMWWIRAAIQEYILHSWSLVKIGTTRAQKKLFFNLRRLKGQLQAIDDGDLKPEHVAKIAAALSVAETEVVSMNRRLSGPDQSLNAPLRVGEDGEWQDRLADDGDSAETRLADREERDRRRKLLGAALRDLSPRERTIVSARWLRETPVTLEDLSARHHISRERVRQIEVRALEKLRKAVRASRFARRDAGCDVPAAQMA